MLKRRKIFRKLIATLVISSILLPSFLHNSIIIANVNESEKDSSEITKEEITESNDNEDIVEDGVVKDEEPTDDTNLSQGNDGTVQEAPAILDDSAIKSVGKEFFVEADGVQVVYKVLTEDVDTKTGTVKVGTNSNSSGNGIKSQAIPTDKTLTIPEEVQNGEYTYSVTELQRASLQNIDIEYLNLPSSLRRIGAYALNGLSIRSLIIPEGVTHIDDQCFGDNSSLRVLKLPSTLETLGSSILGSNGPDNQISVYYPYKNTITKSSSLQSSNTPFHGIKSQGSTSQTLIITENVEQYNKMKTDSNLLFQSASNSCITYEIPLEFYDKDGNSISVDKDITKLYFQDILWEKEIDGAWNSAYTNINDLLNGNTVISGFPTLPDEQTLGYKANYWGMSEMGLLTVNADGKVEVTNTQAGSIPSSLAIAFLTTPKMFAVEDKFIITETISTNKAYDGESSLKISFNRNVGNYLPEVDGYPGLGLTFSISIVEKGSSNQKNPIFKSNTMNVNLKNVADTGEYTLQYLLYDSRISTYYSWLTSKKPISIQITEGQININPQVDEEIVWADQTQLPEISAKEGDSAGTYTWDANQTPQLGTNTYTYTFIPNNLVGKRYINNKVSANNYTEQSKTGVIEITYKEIVNPSVTFLDKDGGVIEVKEVENGKDVIAPTPPDVIGYTFEGWDKPLTNITADTTINAVYKANKYTVKFDGNGGTNGRDITVEYNTPIGNLIESVRDGYQFIGWFTQKNGGIKVTKETIMPLNGATYFAQWEKTSSSGGSGGSSSDVEEEEEDKTDNSGNLVVDVEKDTPIEVPASKEEIKEAVLTKEEIQENLSGTDINIKVIITRIPEVTENIVNNTLNGRKDGAYFDISIFKKVGNQPEVKVDNLNKTMRFVIDIPEELYAIKGVDRVFEVMQIHDGQVDFLTDLDQDEKTITIEIDRFSTFVLCYKDSNTSEKKPNIPETSISNNVASLVSLLVVSLVIMILSIKKLRENN